MRLGLLLLELLQLGLLGSDHVEEAILGSQSAWLYD